jgi:hypothetical protein
VPNLPYMSQVWVPVTYCEILEGEESYLKIHVCLLIDDDDDFPLAVQGH